MIKALAWAKSHSDIQAVYKGYKTINGVKSTTQSYVFVVAEKKPMADVLEADRIPSTMDGKKTDVIENTYHAFDVNTGRRRPCPAGFSIGHHLITAGTFGLPVKLNDKWMALTNNHVGANSNDARIGDNILQPGKHDGGVLPPWAKLFAFHLITFEKQRSLWQIFLDWLLRRTPPPQPPSTPNRIDAAICEPLDQEDIIPEIAGIGPVKGISTPAALDLLVQKVGRTTGHTFGKVVGTDGFVRVDYGTGIAAFEGQIIIESVDGGEFSAGGDSGSGILDMDAKVVGLLYAGGEGQTIANQIQDVIAVWPDLKVI